MCLSRPSKSEMEERQVSLERRVPFPDPVADAFDKMAKIADKGGDMC